MNYTFVAILVSIFITLVMNMYLYNREKKGAIMNYTFITDDLEGCDALGVKIHELFRGNYDYVESNLILNVDTRGTIKIFLDKNDSFPETEKLFFEAIGMIGMYTKKKEDN